MDSRIESPVIDKTELQASEHDFEAAVEHAPLFDQLLSLASEHKRDLVKGILVSLLISVIVAFVIPKRYESTVRLMPPDSGGQGAGALLAAVSGKLPAGIGELASGLLGMKNQGPLYVDLLQSRTILDHQLDRFELQKVYWKRYRESARKKLKSRTTVTEDRKSGVITISVEDKDPARAQGLAQGYVNELDQLLAQVSTSSARRERLFIEKRLEAAKVDLNVAETDFSRFASKNNTLDIKEQTKAMVSASAELQGQIIVAESQLQGLTEIYTPNNVRVRSAQARIDELKRQLTKLSGSAKDASPTLAEGELYPSIRQLPILGVQWADLFRKVKIQETIFELLTQQYELAKIQEAKEIPTIRVIDPADYPERRSWPPRVWIIVIGTLLGFVLTIVWFKFRFDWARMDEADPWKIRWLNFSNMFRRGWNTQKGSA